MSRLFNSRQGLPMGRPKIVLLVGSLAWGALANDACAKQLPGIGPDSGPKKTAEQLVPAQAMADIDVVRPGQRFHLVVALTIERGWHIYWLNPGDSGMPTEVQVKAPAGFEVGPTRYPRPQAIKDPAGMTYGYFTEALLFVPVTAPDELPDGEVSFALSMSWLTCKKVCLLGSAQRQVTLKTASAPLPPQASPPPLTDRRRARQIGAHRARLPGPLRDLDGARIEFDGGRLSVTGPAGAFESAAWFPVDRPGVSYGKPAIRVAEGQFQVEVDVELKPENARGRPLVLQGVVALGDRLDDPCYDFNLPVTAEGAPAPGE